jgi:hypothetical protein
LEFPGWRFLYRALKVPRVIRLLVNSPRWIFLAALVFGPWAYGCTRPWAMHILDGMLGVVIVLWLAGCAIRRQRPFVPWALAGSALLLLLQGWWMILNVAAVYDRKLFVFNPVPQLLAFAPAAVDRLEAIPTMLNDSAMLGAVCFVADLAQRPVWRTRVWWTAALNGILLMLCGLGMKICGIHITSYLDPTYTGNTSFAFYLYHGNAGAFINLILPLVAGLTVLSFARRDAQMGRALWLPGLLICIAGSVASLSKAGMVIALGLLIWLTIWFFRFQSKSGRISMSRTQMGIFVACAVLVVGMMLSMGWYGAKGRWAELATPVGKDESVVERLLVCQVCIHMMADSGFWGFGPGNFMICFPLLGVIFFGGIWAGSRRLWGKPLAEGDRVLLMVTLMALAGVAFHAASDFPLQIASIQLYAATYLGICWGSAGFATPTARVSQRRSTASRLGVQAPAGGAA